MDFNRNCFEHKLNKENKHFFLIHSCIARRPLSNSASDINKSLSNRNVRQTNI